LITIYTKDETARRLYNSGYGLHPPTTHDSEGKSRKQKWVTLRAVLKNFPPLDSKSKATSFDPKDQLHHVPVLDPKKYEWIKCTPENGSAFDNQCVNPECRYRGNPSHGAAVNEEGINRAKTDTPLYCIKCGSLLPRPYVEINGQKRIMHGYTSAYKRMRWDLPASTITRNFSFPCSDHKIHPVENRVLSISEACKVQSISDYNYSWGPIVINGRHYRIAPDTLIRNVIGESVPPLITCIIGKYLKAMSKGEEVLHSEFPQTKHAPETERQVRLDQFNGEK
jgi:DNA (cytosine-5)-methyltransferase 1